MRMLLFIPYTAMIFQDDLYVPARVYLVILDIAMFVGCSYFMWKAFTAAANIRPSFGMQLSIASKDAEEITLADVMNDKDDFELFHEHCENEYNCENINFIT